MARAFLQPGFRFHPTDVELVMYYLKRKVTEKSMHFEAIRELDLYKFAPWDLPDKSCMQTGDLEWYFYCARDKKYANGIRANRATDIGYWKTTGRDRPVNYDSRTVGMRKTLVFHLGRAPRGDRTNWVMHEYRLQDTALVNAGIPQDSYVLCKVFEKSGAGPKNGEQYGAPFREEDWEDDLQSNLKPVTVTVPECTVVPLVDAQNSVMKNIGFIIGDVTGSSYEPIIPCQNCSEKLPLTFEDGDTEPSLAGLKEDVQHLIGNDNNEKPEISNIASTIESPTAEEVDDIFIGLEDLNSTGELKKADRMNLPNLGSKYASSQMLLGGDGSYMELLDLECPVNLPDKACASEHLQYNDIGTGSEPKIVNKFKFSNCLDNKSYMDEALLEEDKSYVELGDLRSSVTVPEKFSDSCPIVSSNLKLKGVDEFHFSVSPGDNFFMDQLFENDRSYVELNDLVNPLMCPVEANHSKQVASEDLLDCFHEVSGLEVQANKSFLWDASLPFHEGGKSIGGTSVSGYENYVQNPGVLFTREAGEETFISEDPDRGEQQIAYSSSLRLLDSIPARPASAAEHPPINGVGKGSKGSSFFGNYAGSSICVKAEVTVRCRCTEDALSGKLGELSCLCNHRGRCIRGDTMKDAATLGGGFTFVFLLGMLTALFWVCVFAVAAKLGQYTWKLIIS